MLGKRFNDKANEALTYIVGSKTANYLTAERHLPSPSIGALALSTVLLAGCASEAITPRAPATTPAPAPIPTARTNTLPVYGGKTSTTINSASYRTLAELGFIVTKLGDNEVMYLGSKEVAANCRLPIKLLPEEYCKQVINGEEIKFVPRGSGPAVYAFVRTRRNASGKLEVSPDTPEDALVTKIGKPTKIGTLEGVVGTRELPKRVVDWERVGLVDPDKLFFYIPTSENPPKVPGQPYDPRKNTAIVDPLGVEEWTEIRRHQKNPDGTITEFPEHNLKGKTYIPVLVTIKEKPKPPVLSPQQIQAQREAAERARIEAAKQETIRIDGERRNLYRVR